MKEPILYPISISVPTFMVFNCLVYYAELFLRHKPWPYIITPQIHVYKWYISEPILGAGDTFYVIKKRFRIFVVSPQIFFHQQSGISQIIKYLTCEEISRISISISTQIDISTENSIKTLPINFTTWNSDKNLQFKF